MERDYSMMIRADAKAMGAVTATDTRYSERWQGSSEEQRVKLGVGTSECVSYKLDADGNKVEARIFHPKHKSHATSRRERKALSLDMQNALLDAQAHQVRAQDVGNNSDVD